jgi:hypothetical protein
MKFVKECIWAVAALALAVGISRIASAPGPTTRVQASVSTCRLTTDDRETHASVARSTVGALACDDATDDGQGGDGDDGDNAGGD